MSNLTQYLKRMMNTSQWIPTGYSYRPGMDGLHTEIEHFNACLMLTPAERALRIQAVKRIETLASQVWPTARVRVFGSYQSGMFFPDSDIDFDISGVRDRFPSRVFEAKLLTSTVPEPKSVAVNEEAIVPLIKLVDRASKLKVDISFNNREIADNIELMNNYNRMYPVLRKLVRVLK